MKIERGRRVLSEDGALIKTEMIKRGLRAADVCRELGIRPTVFSDMLYAQGGYKQVVRRRVKEYLGIL